MLRSLAIVLLTSFILVFAGDVTTKHGDRANAQSFNSFDRKLKKVFRSNSRSRRRSKRRRGLSPEALIGGAVLGGIVGSKLGNGRVIGVVAGGVVGAFIANEIAVGLNLRQKRAVSRSTLSALITGEDSEWRDRRSRSRGRVKVLRSYERKAPVRLKVRKDKIEDVPPLEFIAETYKLTSNTNVRGGPDTSFKKVDYLRRGTKIHVVGKVVNKPWYMISQNGIGSGFVFAELLKPAGSSIAGKIPEPDGEFLTFDVDVAESMQCRTLEQSITTKDKTSRMELVSACKGANGWQIAEASAAE